jgi:hypothetical protein
MEPSPGYPESLLQAAHRRAAASHGATGGAAELVRGTSARSDVDVMMGYERLDTLW